MRPSYIPFSETATSIFLPGSEHVSANPLRKIHQVAFMSKDISTSFSGTGWCYQLDLRELIDHFNQTMFYLDTWLSGYIYKEVFD
jgi:hypothetical protein